MQALEVDVFEKDNGFWSCVFLSLAHHHGRTRHRIIHNYYLNVAQSTRVNKIFSLKINLFNESDKSSREALKMFRSSRECTDNNDQWILTSQKCSHFIKINMSIQFWSNLHELKMLIFGHGKYLH